MANKNRRKGHNAERHYMNIFKKLGFEFCVTSRYGSRLYDDSKIDLINLPFNIQIKAGKQTGLNPGRELLNMQTMIKKSFPPGDPVFDKPCFVFHKKDVGRGFKNTEEHETVFMSHLQFNKYKKQIPKLKYLYSKKYKMREPSEYKSMVAMSFEYFINNIIKKLYKNGNISK